jgi:NitT/TauT family transport system permease protein
MTDQPGRRTLTLQLSRCALLVALIGGWQLASVQGYLNPILIGKPSGIAAFLWKGLFINGSLLVDLGWTMLSTLLSFSFGSILGITVGMIFIASPFLEALLSPFLMALNAMPRIALAPLFLIWFGLGIASKVAIGFSLCFFIVLTNTVAGGRALNQDHVVLARTLNATSLQVFTKFTLPTAVPVIFNGLRLGLIFSLLGVVAGEIIAAEHGVGQTLSVLAASFQTDGVFAIIILLSLIGLIVTWSMTLIENRLLHWR